MLKGRPLTDDEFQTMLKAVERVVGEPAAPSWKHWLEGLWWSADMAAFTTARDKSKWSWTMMIMQPDWITQTMFEEAVAKVKLKTMPASLGLVRLKTLHEGHCVQTLHIGSYDDEADVLAAMHYDFLPANKLRPTMKHHEVYLSDARKVGPDKLRTILRQPVENL